MNRKRVAVYFNSSRKNYTHLLINCKTYTVNKVNPTLIYNVHVTVYVNINNCIIEPTNELQMFTVYLFHGAASIYILFLYFSIDYINNYSFCSTHSMLHSSVFFAF